MSDQFDEFTFVWHRDEGDGTPFHFRTGCGCCDVGDTDLSNERAESLAIALVQATPGDEQAAWFMADVGRVACPPHSHVMVPGDAIALGLALIRAAGKAKEAK